MWAGFACAPCASSEANAPGLAGSPDVAGLEAAAAAAEAAKLEVPDKDAVKGGGAAGPLHRHTVAALSSLLMAQLCSGAAAGEPPIARVPAEQRTLEEAVPRILRLLLVRPIAAPFQPMLMAALWGLARTPRMRNALVDANAVAVIVEVMRALWETDPSQPPQLTAEAAAQEEGKKAAAATAAAGTAAAATSSSSSSSPPAAAPSAPADRQSLFAWGLAVLWTLCDPGEAITEEAARVEAAVSEEERAEALAALQPTSFRARARAHGSHARARARARARRTDTSRGRGRPAPADAAEDAGGGGRRRARGRRGGAPRGGQGGAPRGGAGGARGALRPSARPPRARRCSTPTRAASSS